MPMRARSFRQSPLGGQSNVPGGWGNPPVIYSYELDFVVDRNGRLDFRYSKSPVNNAEDPGDPRTRALDIKIDRPCWIEVTLAARPVWRWAPENAVATEDDHKARYFLLQYFTHGQWESSPKDDMCQRIRFGAVHEAAGRMGDGHKFNYNLELLCSNGKYLPITLDPDIRNPGNVP